MQAPDKDGGVRESLLVLDVPARARSLDLSLQLVRHGFRAVEDNLDGSTRRLWIHCPHGTAVDRESARRIVAQALSARFGHAVPVRFQDETAH